MLDFLLVRNNKAAMLIMFKLKSVMDSNLVMKKVYKTCKDKIEFSANKKIVNL